METDTFLKRFTLTAGEAWAVYDLVKSGVNQPDEPQAPRWMLPVGYDPKYPINAWYIAVWHDLTGRRNDGYVHTGVDINLDRGGRGDVERRENQTVHACARGEVVYATANWYGVPMVVIEHTFSGAPLYTRYAHIVPVVGEGDVVEPGRLLGTFANWRTGDHLHLDMTRTPYTTGWITPGAVDPLEVFAQAGIEQSDIDAMARTGD
jgi:murein DD-endopeptidase MepM/ murein hydrolase activator NlpD